MKFIDREHRNFYEDKYEELMQLGKTDVYHKSLVYVLGICDETRRNFNKIFNMKKGNINIDSLEEPFQTSSSAKVTRLAFSLWNGCNYDSKEDIDRGKLSTKYNVDEIFCCGYAPYFYEGIKIRYPEYTREKSHDRER